MDRLIGFFATRHLLVNIIVLAAVVLGWFFIKDVFGTETQHSFAIGKCKNVRVLQIHSGPAVYLRALTRRIPSVYASGEADTAARATAHARTRGSARSIAA